MNVKILNKLHFKKMANEWNRITDALKANRKYGQKWSKLLDEYVEMSPDKARELKKYRHAAHGLIWAKNDKMLWSNHLRASVLMQLRFDGSIGFAGGFLEKYDSCWEQGLNRELAEELNLDAKYYFNENDYFFTCVCHENERVLHFYVKEYTPEEFVNIEKRALESRDYGGEVMGLIKPPLFKLQNSRGFTTFMQNQFIGNSLVQLLKFLNHFKIISTDEIIDFINSI